MENIYLPRINLTPTMECNLHCRLCGVLVPQYACRPRMSLVEFKETLRAVFEIVDEVDKLQITGGEPLLHQDIAEMLRVCFDYGRRFHTLWLFSNASIPFPEALIKVLRQHADKVLVQLSDYGAKPEVTEGIVETLEQNDITCKYLKYWGDKQYFDGWVDQGDFKKHAYSRQELCDVFARCTHVKNGGFWYVRGGQMHWCGRSIRGVEVGIIPLRNEDYLDIFKGSIDERKEKLISLMNTDHIMACEYCNGLYGTSDTNKRHPAGEQM